MITHLLASKPDKNRLIFPVETQPKILILKYLALSNEPEPYFTSIV